jgi:hypothetical protein
LRYQQQPQALIDETAVHAVIRVGKHAVAKDALGEPFGVALGIVATHRNQCEETAAYFTD